VVTLSGPTIFTEKGLLPNGSLTFRNKVIETIEPQIAPLLESHICFPKNYFIVPGFIDVHLHGLNGFDVMDGTQAALQAIAQSLAAEGTTSFLATTMTARQADIEQVLSAVNDFMKAPLVGAKVLGVHLEGPFLSIKKVGAQRADLLLELDSDLIKKWQAISGDAIKLITLAPELKNSFEFIEYLTKHNIVASIGHTNATFAEAMAAIDAGCTHVTHLFNAMSGIHQREPGVVTAALLSEKVSTELIVDNAHLHPAIVRLISKMKGLDKIILVTDAMRAKCLPDGRYDLGGQQVDVKKGVAKLSDGTLAGSTLNLISAIKNMREFTDYEWIDVFRFASENPAKMLGIFDRKGSLAVGKDADFVVLDEKMDVVMTVCEGMTVYNKTHL
jgi:N-acetylglucosamine-6-phosphate deacetylase